MRRLTASAIHSFQVRQVSFTLEQVQFGTPRELNEAPGPDSNTATVLLMVSATVSTESLSVPEGGMGTYTVVLGVQPTGPVTVTPTKTGHRRISVSAALTFTTDNWSTPQTVTVSAEQDDNIVSNVATIAHSARGGDFDSVSIALGNGDSSGRRSAHRADRDPGLRRCPPHLDSPRACRDYPLQFRQQAVGESLGAWQDIPGSGAATRSHTVSGLAGGTTYVFEIRAMSAAGRARPRR